MGHGIPATINAGETRYLLAVGTLSESNDETKMNIIFHTPGRISNFLVDALVNSLDAATTVRLRKNGANSNQSVSVPAGTTGVFEDETNSDIVADGDEFCYQVNASTSATGATDMTIMRCIFTADQDTVTRQACTSVAVSYTTASTTSYNVLCGFQDATVTTENDVKCRQRKSGTYRNYSTYISDNARATTTTSGLRINGATSSLSVSVGAGLTGFFEDTTDSVAVVAGDDVNYFVTTGTGAGDYIPTSHQIDFVSTDYTGLYVIGRSIGNTQNQDATTFFPIMGHLGGWSTETNITIRSGFIQADFLELTCRVTQNNTDNSSFLKVRKNRLHANLSVSIPANTTGTFTDTSDTLDSSYPDDEINLKMEVGAGVGGDTIVFTNVCIWAFIIPFIRDEHHSMSAANPVLRDYHYTSQQNSFFGNFDSPMLGD